jgi:hypothetical protein
MDQRSEQSRPRPDFPNPPQIPNEPIDPSRQEPLPLPWLYRPAWICDLMYYPVFALDLDHQLHPLLYRGRHPRLDL